MVFSSNEFVFLLLPLAVISNLAILTLFDGNRKIVVWLANLLLFLFSMLFYTWGEPKFAPYLFGSALVNFLGGFCVSAEKVRSVAVRRAILIFLVVINLAYLGIFKYFNFFQDIGGTALLDQVLPPSMQLGKVAHIALPIGISFYTFQAISYLLDVYWGTVPACPSFVSFSCYLTMFPQLIAGPIVRFSDIHEDLLARRISLARVSAGCTRFILGLAKKVLLADTFGRVADLVFAVEPSGLSAGFAWLGLLCYTLQIYYDFSAYSDMAIGIGGMLGIRFLENFNYPYVSTSIKEFWRRWHISLSTWFRDYLYIPLGGSRMGSARTTMNLVLVFVLCGFWHGAAWTFLFWGLFHGFFLSVERFVPDRIGSVPRVVKWVYSYFVVMMGWVLFRSDTMERAWIYYKALLGLTVPDRTTLNHLLLGTTGYVLPLFLIIGFVLSFPVYPSLRRRVSNYMAEAASRRLVPILHGAFKVGLIFLLVICIAAIASSTYQSFIYFRF